MAPAIVAILVEEEVVAGGERGRRDGLVGSHRRARQGQPSHRRDDRAGGEGLDAATRKKVAAVHRRRFAEARASAAGRSMKKTNSRAPAGVRSVERAWIPPEVFEAKRRERDEAKAKPAAYRGQPVG